MYNRIKTLSALRKHYTPNPKPYLEGQGGSVSRTIIGISGASIWRAVAISRLTKSPLTLRVNVQTQHVGIPTEAFRFRLSTRADRHTGKQTGYLGFRTSDLGLGFRVPPNSKELQGSRTSEIRIIARPLLLAHAP